MESGGRGDERRGTRDGRRETPPPRPFLPASVRSPAPKPLTRAGMRHGPADTKGETANHGLALRLWNLAHADNPNARPGKDLPVSPSRDGDTELCVLRPSAAS